MTLTDGSADLALVLRPATTADADAVADIHLGARRAAPMPPGIHPDHEVREWLRGRLASDEVWLALVEDEPAGYARLADDWLDDLYVLPEHAGRGIGSALLGVAKARCPAGFGLWVFEVNEPARTFYRRHGLVEVERTDGADNEEKAPDIRMEWQPGLSVRPATMA
ncbi:GNAT family N-acetyltransferase [Nocardioides sp. GCM10027113]|uniref:GNAT family N-acetyltransferase n=1 Tax=unclassified Nocardioides TaxID=2615069 RepID=UPI0036226B90